MELGNKIEILKLFKTLVISEQEQILQTLQHEWEIQSPLLTQAQINAQKALKKPCVQCGSENVSRRGFNSGIQCYVCKDCHRYFRESSGTPLYRLKKKEKLQAYLIELNKGTSIKKTAKIVGISIQTSFDWRHKILASTAEKLNQKLQGQIQCDEMEMPESSKGNRNLQRPARKRSSDYKRNNAQTKTIQIVCAVDEKGTKIMQAVESKRLSKKQISQAFAGKIKKDSTLITDEHQSYKAYAKSKKTIQHKTIKAKTFVHKEDKQIHLQKVNQLHSSLRDFMRKFKGGVSSKYLQNYLHWYQQEKNIKLMQYPLQQWFQLICTSQVAYQIYILFLQNKMIIRT